MSTIDMLLHRFLDDPTNLSGDELDALVAALRARPEQAVAVREQLMLDDLLAQKLTLDRRNFPAQVEQRIADYERSEEQLDQQVAELRELAATELERPTTAGSGAWFKYVALVSAALLLAMALVATRFLPPAPQPVAKVADVEGEVKIQHGERPESAATNVAVVSGRQIKVPSGGTITIAYQDATTVRVKGDSAVTFGGDPQGGSKQVRIERGEVVATVAPQSSGAMRFTTPHAVADVLGAQLRLVVSEVNTLLDVSEGQVQFDRLADGGSIVVAAHETGMATSDALQLRPLTWPDNRDGVAYLYSPLETTPEDGKPLMVARNPQSGNLRKTDLQQRGDARMVDSPMSLELSGGGCLISDEAGPDILATCADRSELTLEVIFAPKAIEQTSQARIVALADDGQVANLLLAQDGGRLSFTLLTEAAAAPVSLWVPLAGVQELLHLAVTYRSGQLVAYRDGTEIARSEEPSGSLGAWRSGPLTLGADGSGQHTWCGTIEACVLYNRCLEPTEVSRNARNYRLLAGRGM